MKTNDILCYAYTTEFFELYTQNSSSIFASVLNVLNFFNLNSVLVLVVWVS